MRLDARAQVDLALLAVIHGEPGDGAAVMRALRERSGGRITATATSLYPALHRLERNRLVRRRRNDAGDPGGRGERGGRGYVLTAAGRRSLVARQRQWESLVQALEALLPPTT